jgi:hypothetical protein
MGQRSERDTQADDFVCFEAEALFFKGKVGLCARRNGKLTD